MFSCISVVPTGYILLIHIFPMLKAGKKQTIASSTALGNLFKNYLKGTKKWWRFAQLYKKLIYRSVLEFSTVNTES